MSKILFNSIERIARKLCPLVSYASLRSMQSLIMTTIAYTEQNDLEKSLTFNDKPEKIESLKSRFRPVGQQIINNAFDAQGLNIIVAPGDSSLCIHAATAGK